MLPTNRLSLKIHGRLCRWAGIGVSAVVLQLALAPTLTGGAQEVFVTRGPSGSPIFSDKPQPGAKPITLPPLNLVEPVPVAQGSGSGATVPATEDREHSPAAGDDYRNFKIVFPEDGGSVVASTGVFEVRVVVEPTLRVDDGHALSLLIDGRAVGRRFTATEFMIPPEFWGDTLPAVNQGHQLDAAIVDRSGLVLKQAMPVRFYLRSVPTIPRRPMPVPVHADRPKVPAPPTRDHPSRPLDR